MRSLRFRRAHTGDFLNRRAAPARGRGSEKSDMGPWAVSGSADRVLGWHDWAASGAAAASCQCAATTSDAMAMGTLPTAVASASCRLCRAASQRRGRPEKAVPKEAGGGARTATGSESQ